MSPADHAAPPGRRRRRFLWTVLGLLLLVVGAFVGFLVYRHYANERLLRDAIAEVETLDPHWRLEAMEAHRAAVPDEENSVNIIQQARAPLGPANGALHSRMIVRLEQLSPQICLTDKKYQSLKALLDQAEPAIAAALSLADYPRGHHSISFDPNGMNISVIHASDVNELHGRVLQPLLLVRIHEGDLTTALRACLAVNNLGGSLGDDPLCTVQLSRATYHDNALRELARVLGHGEVSDAQLAPLQQAFADESAYDPWPLVVRGSRAITFRFLQSVGGGLFRMSELHEYYRGNFRRWGHTPPTAPADEYIRDVLGDRIAPDVRPAQAWALRYLNRQAAVAELPWPERRAAIRTLAGEIAQAPELARLTLDPLDDLALHFQMAQARSRAGVTMIALERYRLRHGSWPESLAALIPELLPAVPADPFDGQPLRYRRLADGVVIYSVGEDGQDDGGHLADNDLLVPVPSPGTDLGFRLWDVPHRRQLPPEAPR